MTLYPVPFRAEHVWTMDLQPAQAWMEAGLEFETLRAIENQYANTLMRDGEPIVCCGAIPLHAQRGFVWAYISAEVDRSMFRAVHGWAKTYLAALPFRRLEAIVDHDFAAAHRWVRSLGFELETPEPMRAYTPIGRACQQYAMIRCS